MITLAFRFQPERCVPGRYGGVWSSTFIGLEPCLLDKRRAIGTSTGETHRAMSLWWSVDDSAEENPSHHTHPRSHSCRAAGHSGPSGRVERAGVVRAWSCWPASCQPLISQPMDAENLCGSRVSPPWPERDPAPGNSDAMEAHHAGLCNLQMNLCSGFLCRRHCHRRSGIFPLGLLQRRSGNRVFFCTLRCYFCVASGLGDVVPNQESVSSASTLSGRSPYLLPHVRDLTRPTTSNRAHRQG